MCPDINAAGLPVAPGGPSPAGSFLRASVYYDGFNLYHALDDLGAPHLKWLDLRALAEKFIRRGEVLGDVVWCTARNNKDHKKAARHRAYEQALRSVDVECVLGHFVDVPINCRATCREEFVAATEKEGDVNVAIRLISDAHLDKFDVAYLVSADSDQAATAVLFKARFPNKKFITVAPPGRSHSKLVLKDATGSRVITRASIEHSIFKGRSVTKGGRFVVERPDNYAPPARWQPIPMA